MPKTADPASFRDPSGFIFHGEDGHLYRQINASYADTFRRFTESGLYGDLVNDGLLVGHEDVGLDTRYSDAAALVIRPRKLPFISYPYEWCFSQLKDAALLTLRIQKRALESGFSLKDCSAYNVVFEGATPIFIDTLSFETYSEGKPWVAYRQFCQHFLAPLSLMAHCDVRLNGLLRAHIDGVPIDLASRLLPFRTRLNFGLLTHIHLHASVQRRDAKRQREGGRVPAAVKASKGRVSANSLRGMIHSLLATVKALSLPAVDTEWIDYYSDNNYSETAAREKDEKVAAFIERIGPALVWDLGANTGRFSFIAAERGATTVAFDLDWACVERLYHRCKREGIGAVIPLSLDLANPSPGMGWAHGERKALAARGPADLVLALALIHHLAIGNNVPLPLVAAFFSDLARNLVIEFVPKDDAQTQRLLESREDVFAGYSQALFEEAFAAHFTISEREALSGSDRVLYLMEKK